MTDLLAKETAGALAPKKPMHTPKAKAVIMLFMEGGPSQVDTFDPKPALSAKHKLESKRTAGLANGFRFYVGSPFKSRKVGQSGLDMSDQWVHLPEVADELCNYRGCQAESLNHPEALFHMNTGSRLGGDPALGSWINYGLGTENQNLPGYVVMTELAMPQGGSRNWSNGFLPAHYQGTRLRPSGSPILDLQAPKHKTRDHQRKALDELAFLNQRHAKKHPEHADLAARMESYELAYRMQMEVPGVIDLKSEPESVREAYGMNQRETAEFGRQCLMARRLVEKGVRFVQIFSGGWDSHDYLERGHSSRIKSVDKPMTALIKDLKEKGMLEDTLVVWTGEFGRTPTTGLRDPLLETFIFDFDRDIYGQFLEVALVHYLRPEVHFPSLDAMVEQMHKDGKSGVRVRAIWNGIRTSLIKPNQPQVHFYTQLRYRPRAAALIFLTFRLLMRHCPKV